MVDEFEPSADENDRASNAELSHNQDSVERIRALAKPESHPDFDGRHCVDCGEAIPKPRLTLPEATNDTLMLTKAALWGLKRIYRPGFDY